MKFIRGLINLNNKSACVATIGNFDGIHLAHQEIINKLITQGKKMNLPVIVISFYQNPNHFFGRNIKNIINFKEKYQLLKNLNVDELLLINFNKKIANLSAIDFIKDILIKKLNVQYLLIGDDFRFGKSRMGDINMLNNFNIKTESIQPIYNKNKRISSSNIREFLQNNDFKNAKNMLGREFSINGKVVYGKQLGRTIGFPTININIKNRNMLISGVFAVKVDVNGIIYNGMANVGIKPTVDQQKNTLEVHIFDFKKNIYGNYVTVFFDKKIRNIIKFSSINALQTQIQQDEDIIKRIQQQY